MTLNPLNSVPSRHVKKMAKHCCVKDDNFQKECVSFSKFKMFKKVGVAFPHTENEFCTIVAKLKRHSSGN